MATNRFDTEDTPYASSSSTDRFSGVQPESDEDEKEKQQSFAAPQATGSVAQPQGPTSAPAPAQPVQATTAGPSAPMQATNAPSAVAATQVIGGMNALAAQPASAQQLQPYKAPSQYGFHQVGWNPDGTAKYEADPGYQGVTDSTGASYYVQQKNAGALQDALNVGLGNPEVSRILAQDGTIPGYGVWQPDGTLMPWSPDPGQINLTGTQQPGSAPAGATDMTNGASYPVGPGSVGGRAGLGVNPSQVVQPPTVDPNASPMSPTNPWQVLPSTPSAGTGGVQTPNGPITGGTVTQQPPSPSDPNNPARSAVIGGNQPWFSNLWSMINQPTGFTPVDPSMPSSVQGLNDASAQFAQNMLANPSRYDNDLFNSQLDQAMTRLSQEQNKDRLNLLRDSANRLGPRSGQLTNEYIDLADSYDQRRNEFTTGLLREAALTQSQDRLAALQGAQSTGSNIFGQQQSLRGESRQEREAQMNDRAQKINEMIQYGQIDRQLGRDAMDDYFRWYAAETAGNEAAARLAMQEFMNSIALAQLQANLPSDGGDGDGGGPMGTQDWLDWTQNHPYTPPTENGVETPYDLYQWGNPANTGNYNFGFNF